MVSTAGLMLMLIDSVVGGFDGGLAEILIDSVVRGFDAGIGGCVD